VTRIKTASAGVAAAALIIAAVSPVAAQQRVAEHRAYGAVRVIEPSAQIAETSAYHPLAVMVGVGY
jgi:hypothetical protein